MQNYHFLNRAQYFKALAAEIAKAKKGERVDVATMDFDPREALIANLLATMAAAATRGAHVTLLVDAHNFLTDEHGLPGPLFYRPAALKFRGGFDVKSTALNNLALAGGRFCVTNIPLRRFNPSPMGRSHIKAAVVGDRVFVGGCNLEHPGQFDVMTAWSSPRAAAVLSTWLERIAEDGKVRAAFGDVDVESRLDDHTSLLLDAGVPGQSLIYEEALSLIDGANDWIYLTCQYFPGGETAQHLAAASARGVHVSILYSHPRAHGSSASLHHLHQLAQRARKVPRAFFDGRLDKQVPKLHAKVLVSEQAALVGSHNYIAQGVRFGTAELAIRSTDANFGNSLRAFMERSLSAI